EFARSPTPNPFVAPHELDDRFSDVTSRAVPARVRSKQDVPVVELCKHEWPIADELWLEMPVRPQLLDQMPRPREERREAEQIEGVGPRLRELDLERALADRLDPLEQLEEIRRR